jgi:MFS family permease
MMGVGALLALTQGGFVVLFLLFVTRRIDGSETEVGILRGVAAIGTVAAGLFIGVVLKRIDPARLLTMSLMAGGVVALVIWNAAYVTTSIGVYVVLFVLMGVPGLGAMAGVSTLLQRYTEGRVLGRVMSTYFAVYGAMQALGMLIAGVFATGAALNVSLEIQGLLYLAAGLLTLRLTRVSELTSASR